MKKGISSVDIIIYIIVMFLMISANVRCARSADWLENWEFNVMGISDKDFDGRHPLKILGGAVLSFAAHEVLGHLLASEMTGMGTGHFDFHDMVAYSGSGYDEASDDQRAWFSAAGFVVQSFGSIILTSIPATRHSDWTLGWNTCTSIVGLQYGITGGQHQESSDVVRMEENGWPGTEVAYITGLIGGVTAYYSLDKYKEE